MRVAYGKSSDPVAAVRQAAEGIGDHPVQMLMAYVGGKLDPYAVREALLERFGPVTIVGGSAAGAISRQGFGISGFELGLIAFINPATTPRLVINHDLQADARAAGLAVGVAVRQEVTTSAVALLLFDSVASVSPPRLHHASSIVAGFNEGIGNAPVRLVGGGLLTDLNMSGAWVFDGQGVSKHAALALVFPPEIAAETVILHGCRPVSAFMEITRIDAATVYELDGQPALHVIERMLGLPVGQSRGHELSLVATLGQKHGDPFAPYDENAYVNRLILRANPESGSITLFEPDFALGAQVQIMSRDNALMIESVRRGVAGLNRAVANGNNLLALYIDCAGRASARSGAPVEEAEVVLQTFDPSVPFMGFYSGVEIAPFDGERSLPLDWTGVLTVLRRSP